MSLIILQCARNFCAGKQFNFTHILFFAIAHHPTLTLSLSHLISLLLYTISNCSLCLFILSSPYHSIQFRLLCVVRRAVWKKGDALITTCYYDTRGYTNTTLGGFSISDEMCVNYIQYYPATKLEVCKSSVSEKTLADYFFYMKRYSINSLVQSSFFCVCLLFFREI